MEKSERLRMVETMMKSLGESLARYEDCQKSGTRYPYPGYGVTREDSKESMLRRITCIREQLLVLGEQLKKE